VDESSETAETTPLGGPRGQRVPRPDSATHDTAYLGSSYGSDAGDDGWRPDYRREGEPEGYPEEPAGPTGSDEPDEEPVREPRAARHQQTGPRTLLTTIGMPFAFLWRLMFPKKPRPFLVELPFLLAIALVLAFMIKTFLVQAFVIPSGSMQNTLAINDRVLVNRFANWMGDEPHRGDVVVFKDPGDWLDEQPAKPKNLFGKALTAVGLLPEDNGDLIKRVIGVGGDHVACKGQGAPVTVNGVPLAESGYLYPGNAPSWQAFDVVVPPGHLWVMGDHREVSQDSRPHEAAKKGDGMVPVSNVVGIAVLKVWPPAHFGTLPVPSTFQHDLSKLSAPGAVPATALVGALPLTLVRRRLRKRGSGGETVEIVETEVLKS
jgi:signal peptidase I